VLTLHDLDKPQIRAKVREAGMVLFVNPHTGGSQVVAGARLSRCAMPRSSGNPDISISVETESVELQLATAAVLAIRGHLDDTDAHALRPLAEAILQYWTHGLPVPWTQMLSD
jgi:hypothetical protein